MAQPNTTSALEGGAERFSERLNTKELGVLLFEQTAPDLGIFNQLRNDQLQSAPRSPEISAMLDNFSLTDSNGESTRPGSGFSPDSGVQGMGSKPEAAIYSSASPEDAAHVEQILARFKVSSGPSDWLRETDFSPTAHVPSNEAWSGPAQINNPAPVSKWHTKN